MSAREIEAKTRLPLTIPIISVIGAPGTGKGTLCKLLAKHYNLFHIGIGELLREKAKSPTKLGREIAQVMMTGENVDQEIVLNILETNIVENTTYNGYLIDGFPRDAYHGLQFEKQIAAFSCILYLHASVTTLKKRLIERTKISNRIDDNETTIEERLKKYFILEKEIMKEFRFKIRKVSTEKPVMEVFKKVANVLGEFLPAK